MIPVATKICSRCRTREASRNHRWCSVCQTAANRLYRRRRGPLHGEARRRDNCRSIAGIYRRRGKLVRQPCVDCGVPHDVMPVEMHHEDYSRPLDVTWLCRQCHLDRHAEAAEAAA